MPPPVEALPLFEMILSVTSILVAAVGAAVIPHPLLLPALKLRMLDLWTWTAEAAMILMPASPVPTPLISSPCRTTTAPAALTTMPLVPLATMPAITPSQEMVMALVMVTTPKPPESRQLISPLTVVWK
jgi:hypothetical protein